LRRGFWIIIRGSLPMVQRGSLARHFTELRKIIVEAPRNCARCKPIEAIKHVLFGGSRERETPVSKGEWRHGSVYGIDTEDMKCLLLNSS
jgi:hypothetical protein